MAALIRRSVLTLFVLVAALAAVAAPAWAQGTATATAAEATSGRAVLADYEDNGQIDGCYTMAQYEDALRLIRPDQQQYGAAVDVIRQAEDTNLQNPDGACAAASAATTLDDAEGGTPVVVWIIVVLGALAIVGGLAWLLLRGKKE